MNRIIDRLWVGDQNDGRNPDALRAAGITAVMNATPDTDSLGGKFRYLRLNQQDGQPISTDTLMTFLVWVELSMRSYHTVLIHCGAGVSRAAAFAIAYLIDSGFSWDEAEALVRSKRPQINPHPILKQSILDYFRPLPYSSHRGGTMADEPETKPEQPTEGPVVEESAARTEPEATEKPTNEEAPAPLGLVKCVECGVHFTAGEENCPNCGAKKPT